jgi:hypothetical protein
MEHVALAGVITFVDDAAAMTPFGVHFMVHHMRGMGFIVPELPSLAELSAEGMLASITDATVFAPQTVWAEWQPSWTDDRKCHELVEALLSSPPERRTVHQRVAAFGLLDLAPASTAGPELRRLLGGPYAGYALASIAELSMPLPDFDAVATGDLHGMADVVAVLLPWVDDRYLDQAVNGPLGLIEATRDIVEDTGAEIFEVLAKCPVAEVADVLDAIGAVYPIKPVAKLARGARHKWQSRWGR